MTGTERKTFQKYYPPDFDPKKLKKEKGRKRSNQFVQRVMAPFNMQCNTCHEYIYKGKKFNMRRETAEGETYLGLKIFRFYFRCPNCLADISFKTDIENVDYTAEHGATRLFEAAKYYQEQAKQQEDKEDADKNDAMKMLEKRMKMSRAEMEATEKLGELQAQNRRNQATDVLEFLADEKKQQQMSQAELLKLQKEEDEREIAELMAIKKSRIDQIESDESDEEDGYEDIPTTSASSTLLPTSSTNVFSSIRKQAPKPKNLLSGIIINKSLSKGKVSAKPTAGLTGIADYGSSSDESGH